MKLLNFIKDQVLSKVKPYTLKMRQFGVKNLDLQYITDREWVDADGMIHQNQSSEWYKSDAKTLNLCVIWDWELKEIGEQPVKNQWDPPYPMLFNNDFIFSLADLNMNHIVSYFGKVFNAKWDTDAKKIWFCDGHSFLDAVFNKRNGEDWNIRAEIASKMVSEGKASIIFLENTHQTIWGALSGNKPKSLDNPYLVCILKSTTFGSVSHRTWKQIVRKYILRLAVCKPSMPVEFL